MDNLVLILLIAIILLLGGVFSLLFKNRKQETSNDLNSSLQTLHNRMDQQARLFTEHLTRVSESFGAVQEIGKTVKDFQLFLKSPKLRGNIGERILKDLLEQVLPKDNFSMQKRFSTGATVDAIIQTDNGIIPIDAKFPFEAFEAMTKAPGDKEYESAKRQFIRDVKKHITDISGKYILPSEGTVNFAIMYIPSETIYYEIIKDDDSLNKYALNKKVLIVSPNSFYYFLRVILIGLEGKKIEQASREVLIALQQIQKDAKDFGDSLNLVSKHLNNAKNAMDHTTNEFTQLSSRIDTVKRLK